MTACFATHAVEGAPDTCNVLALASVAVPAFIDRSTAAQAHQVHFGVNTQSIDTNEKASQR